MILRVFLAALALLATVPSTAEGAPEFPRRIASTLDLNYEPPCSICHVNGQTGDGTPIELFAWSMRARGLTGDTGSLTPALMADEADRVDSDGDGITDSNELKNGTDVNSAANDCIIPSGTTLRNGQCTPGVQASPSLGCSVSRAGSLGRGSVWVVAAWLLGVLTVGRRRVGRLGKRTKAHELQRSVSEG